MKLIEFIERHGPTPEGDLLYVIHDPTTGWSKFGFTERTSTDRLTAIRGKYPELRNAQIVGVLVSPNARLIEGLVYVMLSSRLRKNPDRTRLVGERFQKIAPAAVLRYAVAVDRDMQSLIEAFRAAA